MRTIVNISLPTTLSTEVERGMKRLHYSSKSEFFRHLLREWLSGAFSLELQESRQEHRSGKSKKMNSTKDLW
jgi:metal-responsive CopG/Arc/MetJ family transcriptional regulator